LGLVRPGVEDMLGDVGADAGLEVRGGAASAADEERLGLVVRE
jgi:hypothetical protein